MSQFVRQSRKPLAVFQTLIQTDFIFCGIKCAAQGNGVQVFHLDRTSQPRLCISRQPFFHIPMELRRVSYRIQFRIEFGRIGGLCNVKHGSDFIACTHRTGNFPRLIPDPVFLAGIFQLHPLPRFQFQPGRLDRDKYFHPMDTLFGGIAHFFPCFIALHIRRMGVLLVDQHGIPHTVPIELTSKL